jgi:long-chain acyl-CoA synthetase
VRVFSRLFLGATFRLTLEVEMTAKPWLEHYDPGVPATLVPYPPITLPDHVRETATQRPDHTALIFKGERISFAELEWRSDALARALVELGVKQGDRVAMVMPNIPQMVMAEFAIWKAGAIAAPINPLYTGPELEHALKECGAEIAIVMTRFYEKVKAVQAKTPLKRIVATNIREYLPKALMIAFMLLKEKKDGDRVRLRDNDLWFGDLIHAHKGQGRPAVEVKPEDPALILFTGGTTGISKAALSTHGGLVQAGLQIRAWFATRLVEWDDRFMTNLPLFHVFAAAGVLPVALLGRSAMILIPNPRDLDDVVANIEKHKPTFLPGVPTLFNALLNHPKVKSKQVDMTSIKLCISGAAPLMLDTKQRFEAVTGGRIVEGYALTETFMATVITPVEGLYKPGFVGMPVTDVDVRIVDPDTGATEMPCGQVGEVAVRAPQLMTGYWQRPVETAGMLKDGWLYTGDLGYLDEDGYLAIVDRKKDVIKPSGFQVWPREVEEVIATHPAVQEVGVAGVPDPHAGEAVKAYVVLREGMAATEAEIKDHCRKSLTGYKVPKYVDFRTTLPKSSIGKMLRRELEKS